MRTAIKKIQKDLNITTIYVTHDQEEALAMSDRIAVMNAGIVEQIGTPQEIYSKPATAFVAGFIGTTNFLDGTLSAVDGTETSGIAGGPAAVHIKGVGTIPVGFRKMKSGEVRLAIRPEDIHLTEPGEDEPQGRIALVTFLGDYISYEIELGGGQIVEVNEYAKDTDVLRAVGDRVGVRFNLGKLHLYRRGEGRQSYEQPCDGTGNRTRRSAQKVAEAFILDHRQRVAAGDDDCVSRLSVLLAVPEELLSPGDSPAEFRELRRLFHDALLFQHA